MVMWKMSNPSGLDVDCLDFMVSFEYFAGNRTYPLPRHFERWFSCSHHKSMGFQQKPMGFQQESMGFHQIMILNQKETYGDRIQLLNFWQLWKPTLNWIIFQKSRGFPLLFLQRFPNGFFRWLFVDHSAKLRVARDSKAFDPILFNLRGANQADSYGEGGG